MSTERQEHRAADGLRGQRGTVTMLAVVGMALLLVITVSFVSLAQVETKIGVNHVQGVRAMQAAEAGAQRVFREIANSRKTASYWLSQPRPFLVGVALVSGGSDQYTVSVFDNSANAGGPDTDNLVAVQSTGRSGGASWTVTLLVQPSAFAPLDAVLVANHLKIGGSPAVQGGCGSIHVPDPAADATLDVDPHGAVVAQQGISTSGNGTGDYYKTTSPVPQGTSRVSPIQTAARPVPTVDPKKYAKYADYFLNDNGWAYQWTSSAVDLGTNWCATTPCGDPLGWTKLTPDGFKAGDCVLGWKRQSAPTSGGPAVWVDCGSGGGAGSIPGTFYVRGAAKMSSSPGTPSNPYRVPPSRCRGVRSWSGTT